MVYDLSNSYYFKHKKHKLVFVDDYLLNNYFALVFFLIIVIYGGISLLFFSYSLTMIFYYYSYSIIVIFYYYSYCSTGIYSFDFSYSRGRTNSFVGSNKNDKFFTNSSVL